MVIRSAMYGGSSRRYSRIFSIVEQSGNMTAARELSASVAEETRIVKRVLTASPLLRPIERVEKRPSPSRKSPALS